MRIKVVTLIKMGKQLLGRLSVLVVVFISLCHEGEPQSSSILTALKTMYKNHEELDERIPVNVIDTSERRGRFLMRNIQEELQVPVVSMKFQDSFKKLKLLRSKWEGWINILLFQDSQEILEFFKRVKRLWFTGNEQRIGENRYMDFIYGNIYYIIVSKSSSWTHDFSKALQRSLTDNLRAYLILTYPDENFQVFSNVATAEGKLSMKPVNFWRKERGYINKDRLFPTLMSAYSNLKGRKFSHPVIHKPPWNYVSYDRNKVFVEENGGRDITLLNIISEKLNFTHDSIDPQIQGVERTRGSKWNNKDNNNTFPGIIGALHERRPGFHFYLGDTTQTYNRNKAVDFSFFVLADSGAFVTRAPKKRIPPNILVKPFTLNSWLILIAVFFIGWAMNYASLRHPKYGNESQPKSKRKYKSVLGIIKIFLNQSDDFFTTYDAEYSSSFRINMGVLLITVGCVFFPSYSGMLVSYFSSPIYDQSINTLEELNKKMSTSENQDSHSLGVVDGSSSYGIISTGGGVYKQIWEKMQMQDIYLFDSVSQGIQYVKKRPKFAVFAGRQKLIFDTLRTGGKKVFHINSEAFFTKFKCIAMRTGSNLKEPFNFLILRLHAAGIINKITLDEFNGLTTRVGANGQKWQEKYRIRRNFEEEETNKIALVHMQGIFYILILGLSLSFLIFVLEMYLSYRARKFPSYCTKTSK